MITFVALVYAYFAGWLHCYTRLEGKSGIGPVVGFVMCLLWPITIPAAYAFGAFRK